MKTSSINMSNQDCEEWSTKGISMSYSSKLQNVIRPSTEIWEIVDEESIFTGRYFFLHYLAETQSARLESD